MTIECVDTSVAGTVPDRESSGVPGLVLVGVSGAGKTAVGRAIASLSGMRLVETDDLVERQSGKSVAQLIIAGTGDVEQVRQECALRALGSAGAIVTVGASQIENEAVARRLQRLNDQGVTIVELYADVSEVARREGLNKPRSVGLGAPRAMLRLMIANLHEKYSEVANVLVDTRGKTVDEVSRTIIEQCKIALIL
ncbi:MAG: shikimate kinase [Schaalia turicensis]|nr:shikimate kinase [Schaalia turicensis]